MADSTVLIGTSVVRKDELGAELQRAHARGDAPSVAVRGDKRVLYGEVVKVLDACRAAGWEDVKLVSLHREPDTR